MEIFDAFNFCKIVLFMTASDWFATCSTLLRKYLHFALVRFQTAGQCKTFVNVCQCDADK